MKQPDPKFVALDAEGQPVDVSALNEVAYDPTQVTLDLTKDEKRRTTALMLSIQAYQNIIIKDAEYLRVSLDRERDGGRVIQPATMHAMVAAALDFDDFIAGRLQRQPAPINPPPDANEVKAGPSITA